MFRFVSGVIVGALLACPALLLARQPPTAPTYVPKAALDAALVKAGDGAVIDANARTVQAGSNRILINIARRTKAGMSTTGLFHNTLSEVFYVVEGAGTLATGGVLEMPTHVPNSFGGNVVGPRVLGGGRQRIGVGDVVVVPAGTQHSFIDIEETLVYLNVRIHPNR